MDFDASTLVYIVAVLVYFLYSTFFNKKAPEQAERQPERTDAQPKKAASFDDLLKEIRREQGERERDLEGRSMEEEDLVEEEFYKEEPAPKPKKYFTYEDPEQFPLPQSTYQQEFKNYKKGPLVKLDDQIDLESDEKILGEVEDVSNTSRKPNKYGVLLKNPETAREAIIVSEILRRKHF